MIHGMEYFKNMANAMENNVRSLFMREVSSGSDITEGSEQKKKKGKEIRENPFKRCLEEIRFNILERAAIANYLSYGDTGNLGLVCKDWRVIIKDDLMKKSIESIIYQRFLKGVLIYRPQEESDVGMIKLPIGELGNPLDGTFDLSQCGDVGNYLSISTGYRKGKKVENAEKVEIWLAPRFLIEKELNTTAGYFEDIYSRWDENATVGMFWTWGGWNNLTYMDYVTTQNMNELSNKSLYKNWLCRRPDTRYSRGYEANLAIPRFAKHGGQNFMFIL